jgi:hypothetical protein
MQRGLQFLAVSFRIEAMRRHEGHVVGGVDHLLHPLHRHLHPVHFEITEHHADHPALAAAQPAGVGIGHVAVLLRRIQHPLGGCGGNPVFFGVAVEHE